jgi:hypothetical protein
VVCVHDLSASEGCRLHKFLHTCRLISLKTTERKMGTGAPSVSMETVDRKICGRKKRPFHTVSYILSPSVLPTLATLQSLTLIYWKDKLTVV